MLIIRSLNSIKNISKKCLASQIFSKYQQRYSSHFTYFPDTVSESEGKLISLHYNLLVYFFK